MPRRKQQAPRRAAAYVPDELKAAALAEEDAEPDARAPPDAPAPKLARAEAGASAQGSPAAELSSHDPDSESHLSEASDRMADFEGGSARTEEDAGGAAAPEDAGGTGADSLRQMRAVSHQFLSTSYWSSLTLSLHRPSGDPDGGGGGGGSSSSSSSSCGSGSFDWHQSAVARTLQQVSQASPGRAPEPGLFSTVQLYRQSSKLYGSIFTGASKFRCRDCSAAYDTLVELTVHMNETGHYRDDNHEADSDNPRRWSKPRKRSLLEMEGKEDAQKVLKCMYCGHSFESLQDLSVHMIKTKHYQKVPLKEPVAPVAAKAAPAARKKAPPEPELPSSPDSSGGTPRAAPAADAGDVLPKTPSPYITPNNRYGHQNGASYAWHFEARKSQILKCMECGSSHDSLQELTAHMMVTGHFIKVTSSAMKKGKPILETPATPTVTALLDDKVQSVPLAATTFASPSHTPASVSPKLTVEVKKEADKDNAGPDERPKAPEKACEEEEKYDVSSKYHYLTESDLDESPKGGLDILKSLENTVTSAINKAQNGTPSWGGYPSIHAAYQLPNMMKLSLGASAKSAALKAAFGGSDGLAPAKGQPLVSPPPSSQTSPLPKTNFHAMEELVKKVTEKVAKVEETMQEPGGPLSPPRRATPSPCGSDASEPATVEAAGGGSRRGSPSPPRAGGREGSPAAEPAEPGQELGRPAAGGLSSSTAIITDHPPEQPFVNPLSALQSVMNIHLGKAAKPSLPALDPMSMLFKMSNSLAEKAAVAPPPPLQPRKAEPLDRYFYHAGGDQPIDLTKGKGDKGCPPGPVLLSPASASPATAASAGTAAKASAVASFLSSSPLRENALSDISDMLKNLTESHASKSSTPSSVSERSDADGATLEEAEEATPAQKRKGRQSNWNPQHLLILQAQFAASLRQTADGKFVMSDLSPQERMHVSRFTGLSMTTISHWLANVKYQLRRTGGTKFLKNLDTGHPVFFCNDCASQIRTPATYIGHLEAHLGFRLRDLSKLPGDQLSGQGARTRSPSEKLLASSPEEDPGTAYQCRLCNRTFASKHAVKLHLSKTHGKSPEDHLLYVCELDKP